MSIGSRLSEVQRVCQCVCVCVFFFLLLLLLYIYITKCKYIEPCPLHRGFEPFDPIEKLKHVLSSYIWPGYIQ